MVGKAARARADEARCGGQGATQAVDTPRLWLGTREKKGHAAAGQGARQGHAAPLLVVARVGWVGEEDVVLRRQLARRDVRVKVAVPVENPLAAHAQRLETS